MNIDVAPEWYIYSMHGTAAVTTPINIFGVLIIIFCQKTQLNSLRWHLLTYQTCSLLTDFFITIGTLPVIFEPFAMGRPHGILSLLFSWFGFEESIKAQCIIVFISIFITAGSVELLFFLRYQAILPASHSHKLSMFKSVLLIATYQLLFIILMLITFHVAVPDQSIARSQFVQLYPHLAYLIQDQHTFIVCVIVESIHVLFLSTCFLRLGVGMLIVFVLVWLSSRALHSFQLSTKTRRMHLQLIKTLCYQISVPVIAFYGPVLVIIVPLIFTIPNTQKLFCVSLLVMSLHTSLGTCSMIYFNRPYRIWLISSIQKRRFITSTAESKSPDNRNISRADVFKERASVIF